MTRRRSRALGRDPHERRVEASSVRRGPVGHTDAAAWIRDGAGDVDQRTDRNRQGPVRPGYLPWRTQQGVGRNVRGRAEDYGTVGGDRYARSAVQVCAAPGQRFDGLARGKKSHHECIVAPDREAVRLSREVDGTVGRHRDPRRAVTAAASPGPVPEEASIRGELDQDCIEIDEAVRGLLETAGDVDRAVEGDRDTPARVDDVTGRVRPLPDDAAVCWCDLQHEHVELKAGVRTRNGAHHVYEAVR